MRQENLCKCIKQNGENCKNKKKNNSDFCGVHINCRFIRGKISSQNVKFKILQEKKSKIRNIFQTSKKLTKYDRQLMNEKCGKTCCPFEDSLCKYAICDEIENCRPKCDKIIESIIKKNFSKKIEKYPSIQKYNLLDNYLKMAYKENKCSKKYI